MLWKLQVAAWPTQMATTMCSLPQISGDCILSQVSDIRRHANNACIGLLPCATRPAQYAVVLIEIVII